MSDFNTDFEPNSPGGFDQNSSGLNMVEETRGNLFLGFIGGLAAALISAGVWAFITVITGYRIGLIAIGIGFLVGMCVRVLGKGNAPIYGIMGAALAFLGCFLGNIFSYYGAISNEFNITMSEAYKMIGLFDVLKLGFKVMDLLFYGFAIYEGFKFSIVNR
ncbi:MAG TPA: hypothetical protein VIO64_06095 [Pseudobacteroides sp.]|uniref:hypothetical protein n=1 Tax=Pseudobacteroides sp. TaxID=1968840 RepID=UPI002F930D9F